MALKPILWEICSNTYLIGKSIMSNTRTECAVLSSSALSDKTYHTINIYICTTHTWEWNTQKKVGGGKVWFYWWLVTSPYGSSKKGCARENPARVQIGAAPPRASSKMRGATNMDKHFFASPLRDIQGWKSNGARQCGSAACQVTARRRITIHWHGDAVS